METGKAIFSLLSDSADVGAICADRIYPEMAQQDVDAPYVVYTVTDTTPSATKNATSKLDTARVELYCVAGNYQTGMDLGIAVRGALDRQSGTINGVEVQSIDFDTSDIEFDPDQRVYILEQTYDVRIQRTGTAQVVSQFPGNTFTVEEVDGDPSGAVNKLVFSNGSVSITDRTATITTGGAAGVSYHGRYDTEAETLRSGATATLEIYYTARPDGDGYAESEVSDTGETDTINRTLFYSTKHRADPDTAGDWTQYTTQPADNASFATAKAALLVGLNETDATAETRGTLPLSLKMVRTTTAASTDLLLDTYTGSAAAYSVRKLSKDYTGNCMRVRRSSDEATQDIGFDGNGDVDSSAIATFVGDAYGYVSIWYDQSGNGNNAVQSTTSLQPMIYDRVAAAVFTNGSPARAEIRATTNARMTLGTLAHDVDRKYFGAATASVSSFCTLFGSNSTSDYELLAKSGDTQSIFDGGGAIVNRNGALWFNSPTLTKDRNDVWTDFSSQSIFMIDHVFASVTGRTTQLGYASNGIPMFHMQELIIYPTGTSHAVSDIEEAINSYFQVYT